MAGTFYPASAEALGRMVDRMLAEARAPGGPCPKALIVPHAGYVYSGPIAASAFARVAPHGARLSRAVVIAPAHRVALEGVAAPGCDRLRTPLGEIEVDVEALAGVPEVGTSAAAHAQEHAVEVELPFLQRVAPRARIVPLVAGRAPPEHVGAVLDRLWGGPETLVVVSSDLSHYLPYRRARAVDEATARQIEAGGPPLLGEQACGAVGVNGLLHVAGRRELRIERLDLRCSGDTAGPRDEVVGYGAFALYEGAA
ncbi:MAG TPA: AmmeMemoRadiSam system protein B [Anaeromyxobacteraceae bacterium]|nr:AmmeMemoRadiSam system protein B [Anaeromyxobacteraceae bacterium]